MNPAAGAFPPVIRTPPAAACDRPRLPLLVQAGKLCVEFRDRTSSTRFLARVAMWHPGLVKGAHRRIGECPSTTFLRNMLLFKLIYLIYNSYNIWRQRSPGERRLSWRGCHPLAGILRSTHRSYPKS